MIFGVSHWHESFYCSYAVACYRMGLAIQPHWEIWLILPLFMTLLCALIGRYRLSYLSDIPPLQSLREINQS